MKKILYATFLISLLFTSCDPMDDVYDELNLQEPVIVGDAAFDLTDDDYDELGLTYGSFNSVDEAKELIPGLLTEKYPVWGKGSSALVGYKLYVGNASGVSDYTGATAYTLANSDYPGAGDNAVGFYPDENPDDFIGDILADQISNPTEGQQVLVKYNQYVGETVLGVSNYFSADFMDGTLAGFEQKSIVGDQVWFGSNYGAQIAGYANGIRNANEDYLISPAIDLTNQTNPKIQVNQAINYASGRLDLMNVLVSTNYSGDPTSADWDTIEFENIPAGTSWTFVLSEDYDFSAYEGKTIHIAFKYESLGEPDNIAATWELGSVAIKTPGVEGETSTTQLYYNYEGGEWVLSEGVYYVSADDFDSMGEGPGQPGQYNNFGSSTPPDDYLPTFLGLKYPYAMEADELFVIYPYYSSSSGAQIRGNLYTVTGGAWLGHQSVMDTELQFGHDGSTWVPDNTIKYDLIRSDYNLIGDALSSTYPGPAASASNYGNFDRRVGNSNYWSDAMLVEGFNVLLDNMDPSAAEGQKYSMSFAIYNGAAGTETLNVIKTGGVWVQN